MQPIAGHVQVRQVVRLCLQLRELVVVAPALVVHLAEQLLEPFPIVGAAGHGHARRAELVAQATRLLLGRVEPVAQPLGLPQGVAELLHQVLLADLQLGHQRTQLAVLLKQLLRVAAAAVEDLADVAAVVVLVLGHGQSARSPPSEAVRW